MNRGQAHIRVTCEDRHFFPWLSSVIIKVCYQCSNVSNSQHYLARSLPVPRGRSTKAGSGKSSTSSEAFRATLSWSIELNTQPIVPSPPATTINGLTAVGKHQNLKYKYSSKSNAFMTDHFYLTTFASIQELRACWSLTGQWLELDLIVLGMRTKWQRRHYFHSFGCQSQPEVSNHPALKVVL